MIRKVIGSIFDRSNRNAMNDNFEYLFEGSKRIDALSNRANDILSKSNLTLNEAKKTNDMNKNVQQQINTLIAESGTSDAEVLQARIDAEGNEYPVLKERLDAGDAEVSEKLYFGTENHTDFVDVINKTNAVPRTLYTRIRGDRVFEVCIPFKGEKVQQWYMEKDPNDDFIKLSGGFVSEYDISSGSTNTQGYDSNTGVWNTNSTHHYTTEVGATFTTTFEGNGVALRHLEDTRGGVWRFVVDGDEINAVEYSTYGTSNNTKSTVIFEHLPDGEHTVVGTFMGDDPDNPPSNGAGNSRGWVMGGISTWQLLETVYTFVKEVEVFKTTSNKEFALSVNPEGVTSPQWIPEHNNIGTAFAIEQKVYFDNELQADWTHQSNYYECRSVQVIQKMYGRHPDNADNLVEFTTVHTFNDNGVFTKSKFKVLEDVTLTGYALMCPVNYSFTDKMVTSLDNKYDMNKSNYETVNLIEDDKSLSYLFIGNNNYPNYVGAMTVYQPKKTFRVGETGRRNPMTFIEFRSTSLSKLYPQVFNGYRAITGEVFEFSGSYTIGEIPMANELYG